MRPGLLHSMNAHLRLQMPLAAFRRLLGSSRRVLGPPRAAFTRYFIQPFAVAIGTGTVLYVADDQFFSSLGVRSVRALSVMFWIAYEYSYNSHRYDDMNELHEKASEALLNMLTANKGLYIKLGQAIANQGAVFPMAYQRRFSTLYDDAPVDLWDRIHRVLESSLGKNYDDLFETIDHVPVASASIAQVHRARLKGLREEVALKVQHDYIKDQIAVDLWVYRVVARLYERVLEIPMTYVTKHVLEEVTKEVNFENELENAETLRNYIAADPMARSLNVYIPKNYRHLTGRRVLTSEWVEGVSLVDKEVLIERGFDLGRIMRQYLDIFGRQIFNYGVVHSDPHPGNLIARFDDLGKQQLVLLDHGLYISLLPKFMETYARLWQCLFSLDQRGIENIGRLWGVQSTELFGTLIQLKPPSEDLLKDGADMKSMVKNFFSDEKQFPTELVFLSRTMRMMQNLNQTFGSPVNRVNILTNAAVDALMESTRNSQGRTFSRLRLGELFTLLTVKTVLFFSEVLFLLVRLRQILRGDRYGGKGEGIEDYIQAHMQRAAAMHGIEML